MKPRILVHGGAGEWKVPKGYREKVENAMREAAIEGLAELRSGSSVEGVIAALVRMEDSGLFNAGRGAYPNIENDIELDAGMMDGFTKKAGAVAAVKNVPNPTKLAYRIMEDTKYVVISGHGAERLAKGYGLYQPLKVSKDREKQAAKRIAGFLKAQTWLTRLPLKFDTIPASDTIGAVALDSQGNLAAATSTGGTAFKLPGRVGDSPIPGAGFYALNGLGAVSATGEGEDILRFGLSVRVALDLNGKTDTFRVLVRELEEMRRMFGRGSAGAVAIDGKGNAGVYATTPAMAAAGGSGSDVVFSRVLDSSQLPALQSLVRKI